MDKIEEMDKMDKNIEMDKMEEMEEMDKMDKNEGVDEIDKLDKKSRNILLVFFLILIFHPKLFGMPCKTVNKENYLPEQP